MHLHKTALVHAFVYYHAQYHNNRDRVGTHNLHAVVVRVGAHPTVGVEGGESI